MLYLWACLFIKNLDLVANNQFIKLDEKGLINPLEDRSKFEIFRISLEFGWLSSEIILRIVDYCYFSPVLGLLLVKLYSKKVLC